MPTQHINPFESPVSVDPVIEGKQDRWAQPQRFGLICLLNVPVCLALGMNFASEHIAGMVAGIVVLLLLGIALCRSWPLIMRRISIGGMVTCVAQIFPIIQIICGAIGLGVAGLFENVDNDTGKFAQIDQNKVTLQVQFAAATIITGILVMGAAFAIGAVMSAIFPIFEPPKPAKSSSGSIL